MYKQLMAMYFEIFSSDGKVKDIDCYELVHCEHGYIITVNGNFCFGCGKLQYATKEFSKYLDSRYVELEKLGIGFRATGLGSLKVAS